MVNAGWWPTAGKAPQHDSDEPIIPVSYSSGIYPLTLVSNDPIEEVLGPFLDVDTDILVGLITCEPGDPLCKVEDALWFAAFVFQYVINDLASIGF